MNDEKFTQITGEQVADGIEFDACTPDGGEKTTLGGKIIEALQKEWANSSKDEEDYRTGLAVATRIVMETAAGAE